MAQWTNVGVAKVMQSMREQQAPDFEVAVGILKECLHKIVCGFNSSWSYEDLQNAVDSLLPGQSIHIDREIFSFEDKKPIFKITIEVESIAREPQKSEQEEFLQWLGYKE